ncbi:MAG: hypothetical protein U1F11_08760 [Steroidobacteraceae bacterium]
MSAAPVAARETMDREFIEKHQIVERYLTGRLPPKGVADFERVCRENPSLLEELGMAERVQRAVRLLENGGQPELWQEKPTPWWQKPVVPVAIGVLALALAILAGWLFSRNGDASRRIAALEKAVIDRPLEPAKRRRTLLVIPSRTGQPAKQMFGLGGPLTEFVDMQVDLSWTPAKSFRVSIDRVDEANVTVLPNVLKDSNGRVRIGLNSSVLGPGLYYMVIDALDWRGQPSPIAWVTFVVAPVRH